MKPYLTGTGVTLATLLVANLALAQEPDRAVQRGQNPVVSVLDADSDGTISADEIAAATTALKRLDRDGDGALSRRELRVRRRPSGAGGTRGDVRPAATTGRAASRSLEKPPIAKGAAEKKALDVLADLNANRRGNMNVPENDGRLLRMLAASTDAKNVIEIGTSNGYSGIWLALAVRETGGHVRTFEIDPRRAERARANFALAGVAEHITIVEGDAHETVTKLHKPIDLLFIDADKPGYVDYLKKLMPVVRPGGLIVSHNMNRPAPDADFVEAITTDARLDTLFFHMNDSGVAVSWKKQ